MILGDIVLGAFIQNLDLFLLLLHDLEQPRLFSLGLLLINLVLLTLHFHFVFFHLLLYQEDLGLALLDLHRVDRVLFVQLDECLLQLNDLFV